MAKTFKPTDCLNQLVSWFYPEKPKFEELVFTTKAWLKMITYAHLAGNLEISGYGRVVGNEVLDVKLTEQEVESAKVSATAESQINFIRSIPKDQRGQWVLDWHSHVDMSAFSSSTDDNNYKTRWENNGEKQFPVLIVNKRQEYHAECYISPYNRKEIKVKVKKDPFSKEEYIKMYEECVKDVEELVKEKTITYTRYSSYWDKYWGSNSDKKIILPKKKGKKKEDDFTIKAETCVSCGCGLGSRAELIRGLCDDCWEQMSWQDKKAYCNELDITLSEAEGYC